MDKEMTIEEIESQFDSKWVLIEDPKTDEALKVLGGKVLHYSKDRDGMRSRGVALFSDSMSPTLREKPPPSVIGYSAVLVC